jgi:ketosteroid isomerase-like protein
VRRIDKTNADKDGATIERGIAMTKDPVEIARASYEAFAKKDRAQIETLIADDFHFTSPLDNRIDRAAYFARCWPNSEAIESFVFINLVADGHRVFVTYEGRNKQGHGFRNTEIMTVGEGRITDVEVYFGWSIPHEARPGGFVDK